MNIDYYEPFEEVKMIAPDGTELTGYRMKPIEPLGWYPSADCIAGMISDEA